MSLQVEFERALSAIPLFSQGRETARAVAGSKQAVCELLSLDSLACSVERLSVNNPALAGLPAAKLKDAASRLAARINYLLEPISPIEIDLQGCVVQLRSNPPQKNESGTSYYELLIGHSGEISLARYHCPPGALRILSSAFFTREVLLRLVGDFASAS